MNGGFKEELLGVCVHKLGIPCGDQDVARERDLEASGDGVAIDGADDGFGACLELRDWIGEGILDVALEDGLGGGEIDAGAEGAGAGAGEYEDGDGGVGVKAADYGS